MAIWGVSISDVKNCGWNTAVGCGVLAGCAVAANLAKKIAEMASGSSKGFSVGKHNQQAVNAKTNGKYAGFAVGLAATALAYVYLPGSRFALITDDSTSKMLKLGILQTVVGVIIDCFVSEKQNITAYIGLGGAIATRFGYLPVAVLGLLGTGLGAGYIKR